MYLVHVYFVLRYNTACSNTTSIYVPVSVAHIAWYNEDEQFVVGWSDGLLYVCSKRPDEPPISLEAHQHAITTLQWAPGMYISKE